MWLQLWSWITTNLSLEAIAAIAVVGGAIVTAIIWILRRPHIKIKPTTARFQNDPNPTFFAWDIRNKGHIEADGLKTMMRIRDANPTQTTLLFSQCSLGPGEDFKIGYFLKADTDPPEFYFFGEANRLVEPFDCPPHADLRLEWNRRYMIDLEFNYRPSFGKKTKSFELVTGQKEKPLPRLTEVGKIDALLRRLCSVRGDSSRRSCLV